MSNAAIAMHDQAAVTPATLSWKFIHWGLGLFIAGFVVGFIPIAHYMVGGLGGDVGPEFLKRMTLWWGCPAILAELTLKTGGLGMIAIGLCYRVTIRQGASANISSHERIAPMLCAYGLIAELVTAGAGYVVCNVFWPNFYFLAEPEGTAGTERRRLSGRRLLCVCRHPPGIGPISMNGSSDNLSADDDSMTYRNVDASTQASQPLLLRTLRQERYRMVLGWLTGISAGALWVYSGMPMICH